MKKLILFIILLFCFQTNAASKYEFYGKIKLTSTIDEDNKKHTYDIISLSKPENVYIYSGDESFHNVNKIQLNYMGKKLKIKYDKPATVYCKNVYSADSMYHFTDVICIVGKIKYK
ncbi:MULTISPECIES: hypothetical protein [Acinetobacter]|uniref:Uncharacterized protein n=2 Tax=Acinetobacter TaxID=469 RepID=A0A4Q7AVL2_9GAMM|nr:MULTISPECIES: hypothetical protein [Acinetobacter]MCW8039172.1 hypothetical protein [Acinetobacter entericus]RZG67180.1 hypothetical protein EXE25_08685 [Acinetobacter bouvetii]